MARDHFIPAAFLGRFSDDEERDSRRRRLSVMRSKAFRPHQSRAETIGFTNSLYDIGFDTSFSHHGEKFVDALWDEYEDRLPAALDMLVEGSCDLDHWINVLVPFIGSLLVRDRWYALRLANAHRRDNADVGPECLDDFAFDKTNMNMNRIIGRNRFIGRLLVSDWVVGESSNDLCTSDLGYALLLDQVKNEGKVQDRVSVLVPVSKRTFLVIRPEPSVRLLEWHGGRWGRRLNRFVPESFDATELNTLIARCAQDFIAGSEEAVTSIDPSIIATNSPDELQSMQEYWPYRTKSADLAGIWSPLRQAVAGLPPSAIASIPLHPLAGITDRFHEKVVILNAASPERPQFLQDVISMDSSGFLFEW